jgi:predicted DCC family thiol-disulfide oxidoreductase YuxK
LILDQHGIPGDVIDTIVLIENNKIYTQSTAALRIARKLNRLYFLLYIFILIPPFIRNPIYRFIARNRYKWFGKKNSCMMPEPELKNRFLS